MGLKDTRYVSVEEMLATFLFIVGQNSRYIQAQDRFKRSRFSISTSFHTILKVLNALAPSYMAKPETTVPPKIRDSTRFYPYFKDCVGAIDGTHILAMISGKDSSSYRNRKGQLSQNVLAACNFDLEFIYVLSGWEGSAHDAKVLQDALTRNSNRLQVPEGKFYLVDCGYANRRNFLAPFRKCRSDVFPEEVVIADDNEIDVQEIGEDENMDDDVQNGTQEQQRVNANNWRANIAATMWTYAMHMGS
ncbi:putative nuclease HARBI1 [Brassica napus]|uniref:putative nuclease HARBI1 n=1 Tax=Brassica napus TaxID=3708 RepID=UPI00207A67E3|nr:putative nuclease HARBI1 [Brassica napus]